MTKEEFEAFKKAWEDYPSQDNEGYVPDRGGFKCGWFAALQWKKENAVLTELNKLEKAINDIPDEELKRLVNNSNIDPSEYSILERILLGQEEIGKDKITVKK